MKLLLLGLMLGVASVGQAACLAGGLICYDNGVLSFGAPLLPNMTVAEMNVHSAPYAGYMVRVTDGLQARVCISSGTAAGAYTVLAATSTNVLGGLLGHCQ